MTSTILIIVWLIFVIGSYYFPHRSAQLEPHADARGFTTYRREPAKAPTSYGSYNGRVVLVEPTNQKYWGKSRAIRSEEIRIMMLVNNPKQYQLKISSLHFGQAERHTVKQLFTVINDSHDLIDILFKSYLVSPKLLKARTQSRNFAIELINGRLYYTQYNASEKDIDRALDLLAEIADALGI